ncbi:MAG: hypothetical protein Dasosvirus2_3 [Dasosvirus sp.]|uniref:Minor capsid protein P8 central region domain-containing protein n=1 Tax=Dasosvirus sp. TaxID=2487764 RepID=A0A3G4ZR81_9VIRU|nr:MAG: hypothetical protein Dasosvirus2_3 [Dasosvirus sp.]
MDDQYAPIRQSLDDNCNNENIVSVDIPSDPYAVDEYYYANYVMQEWQTCAYGVSKVYFSVTNIKRIQKQLKKEILERSYGKFILEEDQNVNDLLTSMRAVYDLYSKELPTKITRQVKLLNALTIQYIAPDMMEQIKQYYGYLADIKNPINPLPDPINVNQAGRHQLASTAQLWGL